MNSQAPRGEISDVACPFCGLACDDLKIDASDGQAKVMANGCQRSVVLFRAPSLCGADQPSVDGRPTSLDDALTRAATILTAANQPVFSGFGADVAGVRAALQLADRVGAIIDHMNRGLSRNVAVLQDSGWVATTFAEVQNRADLVIIAGTDITRHFPRFFERLLGSRESMLSASVPPREIIYLGVKPDAAATPAGRFIACSNLGEAFGAMRAVLAGWPLQASEAGGIPLAELIGLLQRMRGASYGVLVWVAGDLDYPHAELTIQSMANLVSDLNDHTRFAVLPIGGNDADMTANQVALWQTGFPMRTGFGSGVPIHDAQHFTCERVLASGEADALLWISAFDATRLPPPTSVATIVVGRAGMLFEKPAAVYIPIATPGIHHAGHFFRGDNVVAVRLRKLVDSPLPTVAAVLAQIESRL